VLTQHPHGQLIMSSVPVNKYDGVAEVSMWMTKKHINKQDDQQALL
jgi:hypothetical protein